MLTSKCVPEPVLELGRAGINFVSFIIIFNCQSLSVGNFFYYLLNLISKASSTTLNTIANVRLFKKVS